VIQLSAVIPIGYGVTSQVIHIPPASLGQARLVMTGDQAQHSAGFQIQIRQYNISQGNTDEWLEFEPSVLRGSEGKELPLPPGTYKVTRLDSTVPCGCAVNLGAVMLGHRLNKQAPDGLTLFPTRPAYHAVGDAADRYEFAGGLGVLPTASIAYGIDDGQYRHHGDNAGPPSYLGQRYNPVLKTEHTHRQHVTATVDDIWIEERITGWADLPRVQPGVTTTVHVSDLDGLNGADTDRLRYSWLNITAICLNQPSTGTITGPTTGNSNGDIRGAITGNTAHHYDSSRREYLTSSTANLAFDGKHQSDISLHSDLDHHLILHAPLIKFHNITNLEGSTQTWSKIVPLNAPTRVWGIREHRRDPYNPLIGTDFNNTLAGAHFTIYHEGPHPLFIALSIEVIRLGPPP